MRRLIQWLFPRPVVTASVVTESTFISRQALVTVRVPFGALFHVEGCVLTGSFEVRTENQDGSWNTPIIYGGA